ncbi:META domain-containing protein [Deinococcus sp.]|uniref:META domain-containing protein n=1 Tax=Deinococcus sp. TaxID=47478 RepID=UPI003CC5FD5D
MKRSSAALCAVLCAALVQMPAQAVTASVLPLVLIDGTWAVTRLSSGQTMPRGVHSVLNFVGGKLTGNTACNAVMGRYTQSGDTVGFVGLASTRKFCAPPVDGIETLILKSLGGAQKAYVYGPIGQRSLRLSGSGGTLYLVKQR